MKPIKWVLKQKMTYWEYDGGDSYGKTQFKVPVQMKCRWEDEQEEIDLPDGKRYNSLSHLYTFDKLVIGSYVLLSDLADVDQTQTPQKLRAFEVIKVGTTPDVSAREELREAWL